MELVTKKISDIEYVCYLRDNNGQNLKAEMGKTVTEATQKMIDKITYGLYGPLKVKLTS
jgi:hypothetical protein|tara:strand:+ start:660 stop:836 length:177 start_codon:yes stop_codon:yes gene_type:complete